MSAPVSSHERKTSYLSKVSEAISNWLVERHTDIWALFWALAILGAVLFTTSWIGPKDCRPDSFRAFFTLCD